MSVACHADLAGFAGQVGVGDGQLCQRQVTPVRPRLGQQGLACGGVVAQGPAVWSRQQDGDSPGVWGATPSDAIRRAFGWRGTRRPLTRAPGELIATLEYDLVFFGRRAPHPDVDEEAPS